MRTGLKAGLEQAVKAAAGSWPQIGKGDPNTIDLFWQARTVEELLRLQVPPTVPPTENGVAIVELVEQHFVRGSLVTDLPPHEVAERAGALADAIQDACLLPVGPQQSYVCALYGWHGCICMAKLLRPSFVIPGGEAAYTKEQRVQGYTCLRECWAGEISRANPWVRYGVSLARQLEKNRKGDRFTESVVEDWVPSGSP